MRRARLTALAIAATSVVSLFAAVTGAQAVVVDMNAIGTSSVPFNSSDQSGYYGVALVPGTTLPNNVPVVISSASCSDPWLSSDLGGPALPANSLCWHGGVVMHSNETFDLSWDPLRRDWSTTRDYIEQFLKNVADTSGTLTTPYANTSQYSDAGGHAQNASIYGGGCIDFGQTGGATCQFGSSNGSGDGNNYPTPNACPLWGGQNQFSEDQTGAFGDLGVINDVCLTDAQIQGELSTMITQEGLVGHIEPGYTPLFVLQLPAGVEVCLDAADTLCSAASNSSAAAQFCSYHGQVNVAGTEFPYVVQPWVASWATQTGCSEPDAPKIPNPTTTDVLANDVGAQLVSPLSQAEQAAIVNPSLNGWFAADGAEINDNGCIPLTTGLDDVTLAGTSYVLQREFNNGGVLETDPNALRCTDWVYLTPTFIVPSAVNQGDVVEFDGSKTVSSLLVPNAGYAWSFGDGTTAIGPSVVHTYSKGGNFTVKLTVTDRGANVQSLSQTISVLGPTGQPVPTPTPTKPPSPGSTQLQAHLQLMPQGLKGLLRNGISLRVTSNQAAAGFVTLTIPRSAARRAHIKTGRGTTVVVGRGTVSGIASGTASLRVHLSRTIAKKLGHLRHVTLTVRLTLADAGGAHVAVDAAGRYAK
jgi:hypothetical protein